MSASASAIPAANAVLASEIARLRELHTVEYLGVEASVHGILIKDYPIPTDAYRVEGRPEGEPAKVDLLLRISEAYPHGTPDMFWVWPRVTLRSGAMPAAGDVMEQHFGHPWQRFSWHLSHQTWQPVRDTLPDTYLPFIEHRFAQRR